MSAIKTFYFPGGKTSPQKITPQSGVGGGGNLEVSNGNLYFLLQIRILHLKICKFYSNVLFDS